MSNLSPPMLHRLDLACKPLVECFGFGSVFLVGSVQERTAKAGSDVDIRAILDDDQYDTLMAGTPAGFATLLDFALGAYVREITGLPIDFQVQRRTEANERHPGKQRNPLGGRDLTNWIGDARPNPMDAEPGARPHGRTTVEPPPRCHQCGPGYRIGDDGCRHTAGGAS